MKFLSLCSGIEAASVAFAPLGWKAIGFSEIEPFPCAVLAHHYPDVPNFGDMTKFRDWPEWVFVEADVIVGGPPCQAFSVAGLRNGLNDDRGNITLVYVELINHADSIRRKYGRPPVVALYENVPGLLSDRTGAFGCLLGGLAGEDGELVAPGGKWKDAGCVLGPERAMAWRVFDAQYFLVAQRRRRVFVVASAREGFDPTAVLFEFDGVRRDTPPRREAGQDFTHDLAPCLTSSGRGIERTGDTRGQDPEVAVAFGGNNQSGPIEVATARNACASASGRMDFESETFLVQPIAFSCKDNGRDATEDLSPTMRSMNHSGSHPNGGGQIAVSYAIQAGALRTNPNSGPDGVGVQAEHAYTLEARAEVQAVCTFQERGRADGRSLEIGGDIAYALTAPSGGGRAQERNVQVGMAVRRLTPRECERLQAFPDVLKTCNIEVLRTNNTSSCYDHLNQNALAATPCLKSQSNASPVAENEFPSPANHVEAALNVGQGSCEKPALVNVRIDCERQQLQLRYQGKLLWSANIAEQKSSSPLPMPTADFARLGVAMLTELENAARHGKVALLLSTSDFSVPWNGKASVSLCGQEIDELVSDAGKFTSAASACMKYITSEVGRNSPTYEQTLRTWLCCVTAAIASSIPELTRITSSYALNIDVSHGYTLIPWRKKPASDCPDGPRYKALGNSWCVNNARWIGARIDAQLRAPAGSNPPP